MNEKEKEFTFGITPLAGARFRVFKLLSAKYGVDKKYKSKWRLSGLVSLISTFFSFFDRLVFWLKPKPKNTKAPVFVIGHWRSGTTFLHNLLCLDPEMGYTTTYQTVFPNNLFAFQWLFKFFMKKLMPAERPVDAVLLNADFPQEEEFALNNEIDFSFYNWWYFPKRTREIAKEYLFGETTKSKSIESWKINYKRFVTRGLMNTKGLCFVSKNPPNTARIQLLLELYPNAKFVFIHRNPYEVVRSTFAFYKGVLPGTQLQEINEDVLLKDILWVYKKLMEKYENDKKFISQDNLFEIKYSDLVGHPTEMLRNVYDRFRFNNFDLLEPKLKDYLGSQKHTLKTYEYKESYLKTVNSELSTVIKMQGYKIKEI